MLKRFASMALLLAACLAGCGGTDCTDPANAGREICGGTTRATQNTAGYGQNTYQQYDPYAQYDYGSYQQPYQQQGYQQPYQQGGYYDPYAQGGYGGQYGGGYGGYGY